MSKLKDETGHVYGNLTVLSRAENNSKGQAMWNCLCSCGNFTTVLGKHLRSGHTVSCGCKMKTVGYNNQKVQIGDKFGYLTVIKVIGRGPLKLLCECDCGIR